MYNKSEKQDRQEAQKKARAKRKSMVDMGVADLKAAAQEAKRKEEGSSKSQTPGRAEEKVTDDGTVFSRSHKTDTSLRGKIRSLVEDPYSSNAAFVLSYVMTGCILLSVLVLCMSTVEDPYYDVTKYGVSWSDLDLVFNTIFTVELFLRITCTIELKNTWMETVEALDIFFWIDFASVVPFWLTRLGKNSFINVLRAFSMSRMLKLLRQYSHLSVPLARAVMASRKALAVPFFFLFVLVLIFASFIYYLELEGENEGGVNSFESIPHAIWFMMVTMTTVGYGDVTPGTTLGKCVCVFAMIMGVLFLSMPLAIVGSNFCGVWDERYKSIMVFKLQQALRERGLDRESLTTVFNEFDIDQNGTLSIFEFRIILEKLQISMTNREFLSLWNSIDTDMSGELDWEEFVHIVAENVIVENESMEDLREEMYMSTSAEKDKEKKKEDDKDEYEQLSPDLAEVDIPGHITAQHDAPNEIENLNPVDPGVDENSSSPTKPDLSKLRTKTFKKKGGGQMIEALSRLTDQPEHEKKVLDKFELLSFQLQQGFADIAAMKEMLEASTKAWAV